jgi:aminoglycoside phosphotransferase (APT) family kinase protein
MSRNSQIYDYLQSSGWLEVPGPESVTFLAAGEYNENHLVRSASGDLYVFRINHGSQLGLEDQVGYEFRVLRAVEASGVTPKPLHVDPAGTDVFPNGVLLMEYLPGGPLDYAEDWQGAAQVFSAVHAVPVPERLVVQADPVRDIAAESLELVHRYPDHPRKRERDMILRYRDTVLELADESADLFASDPFCVVNTEVNSGNFIVDRGGEGAGPRVKLVDWEKAVVSSRFQDIGHFLVPTTTLWKTDFCFDDEGRRAFVSEYRQFAGLDMSLSDCLRGADVMERTILLRAMSWCFMAWYEYTRPGRLLKNEFTFGRIERYLDEMECFLALKG